MTDRHADRALCADSSACDRAEKASALLGVSGEGSSELARWPCIVTTGVQDRGLRLGFKLAGQEPRSETAV